MTNSLPDRTGATALLSQREEGRSNGLSIVSAFWPQKLESFEPRFVRVRPHRPKPIPLAGIVADFYSKSISNDLPELLDVTV